MERAEVNRLFDLLEQLYQGKRKPRDQVTAAIWAEVLKPWSYPQVRDAAIRRARESRFFPDPSELAAYLPPAPGEEQRGQEPLSPWAEECREKLEALLEERHRELRARGVPTLGEAVRAGLSPAEWARVQGEAAP